MAGLVATKKNEQPLDWPLRLLALLTPTACALPNSRLPEEASRCQPGMLGISGSDGQRPGSSKYPILPPKLRDSDKL